MRDALTGQIPHRPPSTGHIFSARYALKMSSFAAVVCACGVDRRDVGRVVPRMMGCQGRSAGVPPSSLRGYSPGARSSTACVGVVVHRSTP